MRTLAKFILERQILLVLFLVALGWLLYEIRYALVIFFIAYVVMAGLLPLIKLLERKKVPGFFAIALPYLAGGALVIVLISVYLPQIAAQSGTFLSDFPRLLNKVASFFHIQANVSATEVLGLFASLFRLPQTGTLASLAGFITDALVGLVAVLAVSIYLLLGRNRVYRAIAELFPKNQQGAVFAKALEVEKMVGRWLRGQLILSLMVGILVWIFLLLIGVRFSLPLAILAGVFEVIPYAGPVLAAIPAVVAASNISLARAITVAIGYTVIQQIEGHILVPNVMKGSIGLPPLVIIFAVIAGAELGGILGALIAIPLFTFFWALGRGNFMTDRL